MYKVFAFESYIEYQIFVEEECNRNNYKIVSVNNTSSVIFATVYEEIVSGY